MKPFHYSVCSVILALGSAITIHAQSEAALGNFYMPSYRGQAGTVSALWNDASGNSNSGFTNAYNAPNNATYVAPGGNLLANASVTQTTPGAFIISGLDPSGSGDIYSFSSANTFVLNYSGAFSVGNVVLQTETVGSELDPSSVLLSYTLAGGGGGSIAATLNELYRDTGDAGGFGESSDVVSAWSWNLPLEDDITSFSINFNSTGPSLGLERTLLDVADFNAAPVPEPGILALAGLGGMGLLLWRRRFGH